MSRNWFDRWQKPVAQPEDIDEPAPVLTSERPHLRLVGRLTDFPAPPPRAIPVNPAIALLRSMAREKTNVFLIETEYDGGRHADMNRLRWAAKKIGIRIKIVVHPTNADQFYVKLIQRQSHG